MDAVTASKHGIEPMPAENRTDNASSEEDHWLDVDEEAFYFYLWVVATPFLFSLIAGRNRKKLRFILKVTLSDPSLAKPSVAGPLLIIIECEFGFSV